MKSSSAVYGAAIILSVAMVLTARAADQISIEVPAEVKTTLTREAAGNPILDLSRGENDGKQVFNATLKIDGSEYEATIDSKGKLERLALRETNSDQPEPTLDSFPPAVKATLQKFSAGAKADRVEKENGRVTFSLIVTQDGNKYRITSDEKGKLLSKEKFEE